MTRSPPASEILALHLPVHLPPVARVLVTIGLTLARWEERRRSRIALTYLDQRLLDDIGLNRTKQHEEAMKEFWRR